MNKTSAMSDSAVPTMDTSQKTEIAYTIIICTLGIPINLYAAFVQISYLLWRSHSGTHRRFLLKFSIQLTISNLITLICSVSSAIWIYTFVWHGGWFLCKLHKFMNSLGYHLWSNMVAAIGFDLLICIKAPMAAHFHANQRVNWLVLLTWLLAIIFALPTAFVMDIIPYPETNYVQCYFFYHNRNHIAAVYAGFETITQFYQPMLTICVCYGIVIVNYRRIVQIRRNILRENWRIRHNIHRKSTLLNHDPKGPLILTSIAIVVTYFLTWFPYQTLIILREICNRKTNDEEHLKCEKNLMAYEWLEAIRLSCTIINPILYRFLTKTTQKQMNSRRLGRVSENHSPFSVTRFSLASDLGASQFIPHKVRKMSELSIHQQNNALPCTISPPSMRTRLLTELTGKDGKPSVTTYKTNGML